MDGAVFGGETWLNWLPLRLSILFCTKLASTKIKLYVCFFRCYQTMKKYIIVLAVALVSNISFAQIGVIAGYKTFSPEGWNRELEKRSLIGAPFIKSGWQFGAEIHLFGANKKRIEFFPAINYSTFITDTIFRIRDFTIIKHKQVEINFITRIYLLDLNCDFDCDSISTKPAFFRKGFFFEFTPILALGINQFKEPIGVNKIEIFADAAPYIGVGFGFGIDLQLLSQISLTPMLRVSYFPDYSQFYQRTVYKTDLSQFMLGCKLQYEW